MTPEERHEQMRTARNACLQNAEAFLSVSERELDKGADHVCFHLALLAMEEIGKSILLMINHAIAVTKEREDMASAMDDHVKKIFWALWGGDMIRNARFTKETIEKNRNLAVSLHDRRLASLYTDARNPLPVSERTEEGEARRLTELVRARLELEKAKDIAPFDQGDIEEVAWFVNATEDPEKRRQIFGSTSLKKFAEVQNGMEWIKWLHDAYRKTEREMREYAEKELRREKPEGDQALSPKYKLRVRIQTPSHSVRNNAFIKWNENVDGMRIYKSDRKDTTGLIKGEILIDFILPKRLHAGHVWEHGLFMSKTLVIALNVGTLGVFWWHVQKDVARFYEEIVDLEADPEGGVQLVVAPHKSLHVGFDEARLVLNEDAMSQVYPFIALFLRESKRLERFLKSYALGLVLFSKTDIHLRLEVSAFAEFHEALKAAMEAFGDWDGTTDFKETVKGQYDTLRQSEDLDAALDLGLALDADVMRQKHHKITLTEVLAMKMYCDAYMHKKARKYFDDLNKEADSIESAAQRAPYNED